jgi:uncharacterized protein (DUF58 family)
MNTLELDARLNALVIARKEREAFLTYYAEDVVSQENDEPERVGRDEWMNARQAMEGSIKRFGAQEYSWGTDRRLYDWAP